MAGNEGKKKKEGDPEKPEGNSDSVDTSALNPMIVQAVDYTNSVIGSSVSVEANGIAYQKVAQATAFSVQDATDYLRNMMAMAGAAQGVALEKMIEAAAIPDTTKMDAYQTVLSAAQAAITAAETVFSDVGSDAGTIASDYPKS